MYFITYHSIYHSFFIKIVFLFRYNFEKSPQGFQKFLFLTACEDSFSYLSENFLSCNIYEVVPLSPKRLTVTDTGP